MNNRSHFKRGFGVYSCTSCGRKTRHVECEMCAECYELAGIYNEYQDGVDIGRQAANIRDLCERIVSKGGKLDGDADELLELIK